MTKAKRKLNKAEIEITWTNGQVEYIQTDGMAYNTGAIVLQVGPDKIIVPMTSVRRFRVLGA